MYSDATLQELVDEYHGPADNKSQEYTRPQNSEENKSRLSRVKKWGKRAAIAATLAVVGPCTVNSISMPAAKGINHCFTDEDRKAAVFCSGMDYSRTVPQLAVDLVGGMFGYTDKQTNILPEYLSKNKHLALSRTNISGLTTFVMYTPLVLRQTLEGNRVEWYRNPTKAEITDILKKPEYNTAIFVGHGSYSAFQADDSVFSVKTVKDADIPHKEAVIQHTCTFGKGKNEGLRESMRAERGYVVGNGDVTEIQNFGEAWKRVFIGY